MRLVLALAVAGLAAAVYLFVPSEGLGSGRAMLAILILAAGLWLTEAIPLYSTALLIPFLQVVLGVLDAKEALAPFFHPVVALLLGGFALSAAVENSSLGKRVAHLILRWVGNRPAAVLLGVMVTSAFLSMWLSNTAATAIMMSIALPIVATIPARDPFRRGLILSIPFAANIGGIGTPVGSPPNPMAMSYLAEEGMRISFVDWMAVAIPLQLLFLGIAGGALYLFFRPRRGRLPPLAAPPGRISRREWGVLAVGTLTVLLWLTSKLHGVPDSIIALVPLVLLPGSGLLGMEDLRRVPWEVLILIGGGLALGTGMEASGLSRYLISRISLDGVSPELVLAAFAGLTALITAFISNTATAALLVPVAGVAGVGMGISPLLVLGVAMAASLAMALPVSTPPNAIAYGTGKVRMRDMALAGSLITFLCVLVMVTLGSVWWRALGYG